VPPPELVIGREKVILAVSAQLTELPAHCFAAAEAGEDVSARRATPTDKATINRQRRILSPVANLMRPSWNKIPPRTLDLAEL